MTNGAESCENACEIENRRERPRSERERQRAARVARIANRRRSPLLAAAALGCAAFGCAGSGTPAEEIAPQASALEEALAAAPAPDRGGPGALVVRLAFGEEADLDLYVTDAGNETVYFGNSPSATGGELRADLRCNAPAPRIETVVFEHRRAGAVRVGVDAPERCRDGVRAAPFVVELRAGAVHALQRGIAVPGRFDVIVLETVVDAEAAGPDPAAASPAPGAPEKREAPGAAPDR